MRLCIQMMFDNGTMVPCAFSREQMHSISLLVRLAWDGVPTVMPEHSYLDILGKEYHIRRQRPFQKQAALFRIATEEWSFQFFASDTEFPWSSTEHGPAMWDCKMAGNKEVFDNDLVMFRVSC